MNYLNKIKQAILLPATLAALSVSAEAATLTQTAFAGTCGFNDNGVVDRQTYEVVETFNSATPFAFSLPSPTVNLGAQNGSSNNPNCSTGSSAYASPGALGVRGIATTNFVGNVISTSSSAELAAGELLIVPQQGFTREELIASFGNDIEIRPNIRVTGSVDGIGPGGIGTVRATVQLQGENSGGGFTSTGPATFSASNSPLAIPRTFGSFSHDFSPRLALTIDPSRDFSLSMSLFGDARTSNFGRAFGEANYESFNSLSFVTDGPAFDLPEGYTIFSSQLNIFDNRWIDPRIQPVDVAPVPLPAGGWMMLSALGLLAAGRKAKKKASS